MASHQVLTNDNPATVYAHLQGTNQLVLYLNMSVQETLNWQWADVLAIMALHNMHIIQIHKEASYFKSDYL